MSGEFGGHSNSSHFPRAANMCAVGNSDKYREVTGHFCKKALQAARVLRISQIFLQRFSFSYMTQLAYPSLFLPFCLHRYKSTCSSGCYLFKGIEARRGGLVCQAGMKSHSPGKVECPSPDPVGAKLVKLVPLQNF